MKSGDIILVKFPFANLENSKKRPALIIKKTEISSRGALMTIVMITSQIDGYALKATF